jgi:hypothetical protein
MAGEQAGCFHQSSPMSENQFGLIGRTPHAASKKKGSATTTDATPSLFDTPNPGSPAPSYTKKATNYAGNYDNGFLEFCQKFLPDELHYWVMDIDTFVIRKRSGAFMLLELKRNGYDLKSHQKRTIKIINAIMRAGMAKTKGFVKLEMHGKKERHKVTYRGYNVLTLSGISFEDSNFKWNGRYIEPDALIAKLAMED